MAPFHLSPERGLLGPNQECYITVVFQPQEALVYQEHATCRFGAESENAQSSCTVLLQGVGMHLLFSRSTDFKRQCVYWTMSISNECILLPKQNSAKTAD